MFKFDVAGKEYAFALLLVAFCFSCQVSGQEPTADEFHESLPHVHPSEINRFQYADSVYFSHLGYETIPKRDGSVILYDRDNPVLVEVNRQGELLQRLARSGRGPGEIQDILSIAKLPGEEIIVYDQENGKLIRYDAAGNYIDEYAPPPFEDGQVTQLYPSEDTTKYTVRLDSYRFLWDKTIEPYFFLAQYHISQNRFESSVKLEGRNYARLILDGQIRGGTEVAFSPRHLVVNDPPAERLYLFWTGSGRIAEISADFDTLRTIPVDLPAQELSSAEWDSLREENSPQQWDTLSELLPDRKVPVEQMKLDSSRRFWLKLNYRSDSDLWLIMDQEGVPQKIVHLPKGSMLTHLSSQHLGVRIDEVTFALYEPVE